VKENEFRYYLQAYINGGCLSASDKLLYLFSPQLVFQKNASVIQSYFSKVEKNNTKGTENVQVKTSVYSGNNKFVVSMMHYLENHLSPYIAGAYVHGSIGTNEEIPYSDFDALVILKNEVLNDARKLSVAARLLNNARSIFFNMDPLQHHGWFVITERDLEHYPEAYFPPELFRHAKSLMPGRGLELSLALDSKTDFRSPLKDLCWSIEKKLKKEMYPASLYLLKNLLSEFMLLPALYVQARNKKGIYKKFSFEEAKKDFTRDDWRIMDEVSVLRINWNGTVPAWKRKLIASPRYFSFNLAKHFSPEIPNGLKEKLTGRFYDDMLAFTKRLSAEIK